MDWFCLRKLIYGDMWSLNASIFICRQIYTCKLSALKSLSQRYILTVFIDWAAVCGYCCLCKYSRSIGQRREDLLENFIFRDYIFNIFFDGGAMKSIIVVVKTISCPYLTADTTTEKALDFMEKILEHHWEKFTS